MSATVKDPVNERYTTSQQSALVAFPRKGVVLHHGATTNMDAIIDMETSGSREVSSNRVVKDARCAKIVDDNMRAWSLSAADWDSWLRSVECANESAVGWTISAASSETLAQQVAFWAVQDGFWPHRDGPNTSWTVYGHREIYSIFGDSYPTACPGGMDLDGITRRAQQILKGTIEGDTMLDGFMYQIVNGGLSGVFVRFGSRMSVAPNANTAYVVAGIINHGIPDGTPDVFTVTAPDIGTVQLIKIAQVNAETLASNLYGAPLGTLAALAKATDPAKKIYPATSATAAAGSIDIDELVTKIAAADDAEHAELLAAIKANPEATRVLFAKALAVV